MRVKCHLKSKHTLKVVAFFFYIQDKKKNSYNKDHREYHIPIIVFSYKLYLSFFFYDWLLFFHMN